MESDFLIDKLTNSIENIRTGEVFNPAVICRAVGKGEKRLIVLAEILRLEFVLRYGRCTRSSEQNAEKQT